MEEAYKSWLESSGHKDGPLIAEAFVAGWNAKPEPEVSSPAEEEAPDRNR